MFIIRLFACLVFMLAAASTVAQGYLRASDKKIVNDKGEIILRGIGLGGWMLQEPYMLKLQGVAMAQHEIKKKINALIGDANTKKFYKAWLSNHCTKADIDSLAAWGFNSVRLPMHYNLYTLPVEEEKNGKNTWLSKGFALTDSLLNWCKANHIYLILDLHAAPGGQGNDNAISDRDTLKPSLWQSEANKKKMIALWEKLATRYANETWIGGYDILNEPNWGFQNANDRNGCDETGNIPLKQLYKDITETIRKVDKKHIIIIEGNCWGNNYNGIFPLWDNNMVMSFHKYWNANDKAAIEKYLGYREKYNVPIWLGETGENSNSWFTDAIELVEANNIGWNMWPLKKAGLNNPLQIKINAGFQDIIDYWNGKAPKPSTETAFKSLMEFAANTKLQNNVAQRGVINAMIRQHKTEDAIPFKENIIKPNAIIFAADYDIGRSDIAYHDTDSADYWVTTSNRTKWNEGGKYRNDGVDIEICKDVTSNGFNIGWTTDGEWTQYSLYANEDATYDVNIRFAAEIKTGQIKLLINDNSSSEITDLPPTGNTQKWQTTTIKGIKFSKGWNRLRVLSVKGGFNLNYLQFKSTDSSALKTN
ncbi:MAG: cellulase family glycosylhydrolase [Ferruginibacter sp.]